MYNTSFGIKKPKKKNVIEEASQYLLFLCFSERRQKNLIQRM